MDPKQVVTRPHAHAGNGGKKHEKPFSRASSVHERWIQPGLALPADVPVSQVLPPVQTRVPTTGTGFVRQSPDDQRNEVRQRRPK